ncbi:hypothetical protein ABZ467_38175 [Streptomyces sp. NPDC005727]|uniref:hypothetical protein n=1 Tax=Streptomyces sp. NPDC005727 TaxID=3157053 RepID=UPI0033D72F1B
MRVNDEGVSNCARCHKSDWSRRFAFPTDPQQATREAREARRTEINARLSELFSRNAQSTQDKAPDGKAQSIRVKIPEHFMLPPPRRPEMERERLVTHVRDGKPTETNAAQDTRGVKKRLLAYGGLVVGVVVCFAIGAEVAEGDQVKAPSAQPTVVVTASSSDASSVSASPSRKFTPAKPLSDYQQWSLAKAVVDARKRHVRSVTYTDLSDLNRSPVHLGSWKVCWQWPAAGAKTNGSVTFSVLKTDEACDSPPVPSSHDDSPSKGSSGSSSGGSTSTTADSPGSDSSTTTELCSIRSNAGNCYHAGEFCRNIDMGATTTDAAGREITCDYEAGANRWQY